MLERVECLAKRLRIFSRIFGKLLNLSSTLLASILKRKQAKQLKVSGLVVWMGFDRCLEYVMSAVYRVEMGMRQKWLTRASAKFDHFSKIWAYFVPQ